MSSSRQLKIRGRDLRLDWRFRLTCWSFGRQFPLRRKQWCRRRGWEGRRGSIWHRLVNLVVSFPYTFSFGSLGSHFHHWYHRWQICDFLFFLSLLSPEAIGKTSGKNHSFSLPTFSLLPKKHGKLRIFCLNECISSRFGISRTNSTPPYTQSTNWRFLWHSPTIDLER
jgi:hypothetical protein